MIANLMMYARPELEAAHNNFWQLIRKNLALHGKKSPETLSQSAEEFEVWRHPNLVLSQTCGMPYRKFLHQQVTLVGTPDYGLDHCAPGYYRSALVVRQNETRTSLENFSESTFAYNQKISQSGYAAPYWHFKPHGFWFKNTLHTNQHLASAKAVAEGHADIASLDAVTWRLIQRFEGFSEQLRVLEWTAPTPGLPYIAALSADKAATASAVSTSIAELKPQDRSDLGIANLVQIPAEEYLAVANPEE